MTTMARTSPWAISASRCGTSAMRWRVPPPARHEPSSGDGGVLSGRRTIHSRDLGHTRRRRRRGSSDRRPPRPDLFSRRSTVASKRARSRPKDWIRLAIAGSAGDDAQQREMRRFLPGADPRAGGRRNRPRQRQPPRRRSRRRGNAADRREYGLQEPRPGEPLPAADRCRR